MIGERNIPTQIQLLYQEQELTKHHRKLEEIHKNDRKKKVVDKELTTKSKLFESRERNQKFHLTEKANAIEKDNELLLGRLVEISRKKKTTLFPLKSENTLPRTLNGPSRKREKDRIATENEAFARRLLSQQPSFNRKKLENDYGRHQERVKNMQRLVAFSPRVKLPPLLNKTAEHEPKTQRNTTDHKKDEKKDEKKHHAPVNNKKKPERITEDEREHTQEEDDKKKSPTLKKVEPKSEAKLEKVDDHAEKAEDKKPQEVPLEHVADSQQQQGDQQQQQQPQSAQQVKAQSVEQIDEEIPGQGDGVSSNQVQNESKSNTDANHALAGLVGAHQKK